jgi:hypothetical protein
LMMTRALAGTNRTLAQPDVLVRWISTDPWLADHTSLR